MPLSACARCVLYKFRIAASGMRNEGGVEGTYSRYLLGIGPLEQLVHHVLPPVDYAPDPSVETNLGTSLCVPPTCQVPTGT